MKVIFVFLLAALLIRSSHAQQEKKIIIVTPDTNVKAREVPPDTNSKKILVKDTIGHLSHMYTGLLNDDPKYNKKEPIYSPIIKVVAENLWLLLMDRYVFNYDYSHVGFESWKHNINTGWEWDNDRFGVNFFLHPFTGGNYFIAGRSSGYTFWESIPFAFQGSLLWEYFGETTLPSYNDLINTTINGAFGGEVLYRITSNILDDRTTGAERIIRETAAGILSPMRLLSRALQGKLSQVTTGEVYQKEPLDIVVSGGLRLLNNTSETHLMLNFDFDYGNPFEKRERKPYDYFTLRTNFTIGPGRKIIDNVMGTGVLYGKNSKVDNAEILAGAFQSYDLWDNDNFELAAMSFTGGIVTKMTIGKNTNLYSNLFLGLVPLAGNSFESGPNPTTEVRDYYYSGGADLKFDATVNYHGILSASLFAAGYVLTTYIGTAGSDIISIVKPRIELHIFENFGVGFEHLIYQDQRYSANVRNNSRIRTEEKLFVTYYLPDFLHAK